ncbi:MAG: LuxR C-terminal-related transcriptional regulator [Balneolaceae bacterium]
MKWIRNNIEYIRNSLKVSNPREEHRRAIQRILNFHPVGNQCVYTVSYFDNKLLYLSGNVEGIFGFPNRDVTHIDFFYDLIHPEDLEKVKKITLNGLRIGQAKHQAKPLENVIHITYRMKNRDGKYLKIQRQSGVLTRDLRGNMLTSFGILTDVTHLDRTDEVHALMTGPEIPGYQFLKTESQPEIGFTKREKEIIDLLTKGLKSREIAQTLFISEHTVYTHRRNILKKAGVNNTAKLLSFVFKNGY